MGPFLLRLDQEWRSAANLQIRAEIEARRAGYLARTGDFIGAKQQIIELRKRYGDGRDGRVSILIMISEALIFHFESLDLAALDRIGRAQLLSKMLGDDDLESIASAWKAHIEFEHSRFPAMFQSLSLAISRANPRNHEAIARIANIISKTATLCGNKALARQQFQTGREHALKECDQASIEALQYNMAAFRLARLRAIFCLGPVDNYEISEVRTEISTAKSLQALTGITALQSYIDLCEARILLIEKNYEKAAEALKNIRNLGPFPDGGFSPKLIDLDIEYCMACLRGSHSTVDTIDLFSDSDLSKLDPDERLVVRWTQLQLANFGNNSDHISAARTCFSIATEEYDTFVQKLQIELDALVLIPHTFAD